MTKCWIGIDGGGTMTRCVIGDENGHILAHTVGPSSNIQGNSPQTVLHTLTTCIEQVLQATKGDALDVQTIYLGLAGADREHDRIFIRNLFQQTPYSKKIVITNDAEAALAAGTWAEPGLLLIAGTGSILYRVAKNREDNFRKGGWGYLFGDEGSGFAIGQQAIRAVLQAYDGRGSATTLTEALLTHYGVKHPVELIHLYQMTPIVTHIASCSRIVLQQAEEGDAVARNIISQAEDALLALIDATVEEMSIENEKLVLHGGLFTNHYFKNEFLQKLQQRTIYLQIEYASVPAVVGAYLLALKTQNIPITEQIKLQVKETWTLIEKGV